MQILGDPDSMDVLTRNEKPGTVSQLHKFTVSKDSFYLRWKFCGARQMAAGTQTHSFTGLLRSEGVGVTSSRERAKLASGEMGPSWASSASLVSGVG